MTMHKISFTVNGEFEEAYVQSNWTLLQVIREELSLTGTKNGCTAGECGACTVLLNNEPVNSCMVLAVECDGGDIVTVEGLAENGVLAPIQEAMMKSGAIQCGFCTPGVMINAHALLQRNPNPTEEEIKTTMVGNLCRCTGYVRIIEGIQEAAKIMAVKA